MTIPEGVAPALAAALERRGYTQLTPVQEAVVSPELVGQDLLVSAQTGSGKTVAFGLAAASNIIDPDTGVATAASAPLALIVAPTRELALQVKQELIWLYADAEVYVASCIGGMSYRDEIRALERGVQIVVGTPGRLVDHVNRGTLDLSGLAVAVLDEADEMLDLGFREELETLLSKAPKTRRTLMFSATVSRPIQQLAENYQRNAQRLNLVSDTPQHADIDYRVNTIVPAELENAVFNILRYYDAPNAIVFCGTRANVNHLAARLSNRGFSVVALSGELSQKERSHALQAMRDGRAKVCVATDVAARGIDLPGLELVVHADLPRNQEALLHRSGRTGRAGRKGVSIILASKRATRRVSRLLQDARIDEADWSTPPSAADVRERDEERLLADKVFIDPIDESAEADMVKRLVELHGPEKLAAAFLRVKREKMAAPEELSDPEKSKADRKARRQRGEDEDDRRGPRKPRPIREDFSNGQWISLTIGRRAGAEPRWLLPMLCKAGGLERKDIGAIRIGDRETFVELAPDAAPRFMETVGPGAVLEKSIRVEFSEKPDEARLGASESASDERPSPRPPKRESVRRERPEKRAAKPAKPRDKKQTYDDVMTDEEFEALPRGVQERLKARKAGVDLDEETPRKPKPVRTSAAAPRKEGAKTRPAGATGFKKKAGKPSGDKRTSKRGASRSGGPSARKPSGGRKPRS